MLSCAVLMKWAEDCLDFGPRDCSRSQQPRRTLGEIDDGRIDAGWAGASIDEERIATGELVQDVVGCAWACGGGSIGAGRGERRPDEFD